MEQIEIYQIGKEIVGQGMTAYEEYKPERAIREVAEKVNEIIDFINDKKDQLL